MNGKSATAVSPSFADAPAALPSVAGAAFSWRAGIAAWLGFGLCLGLLVMLVLLVVRARRHARGKLVPVTEDYLDEDKVLAALGFDASHQLPHGARGAKPKGGGRPSMREQIRESRDADRELD